MKLTDEQLRTIAGYIDSQGFDYAFDQYAKLIKEEIPNEKLHKLIDQYGSAKAELERFLGDYWEFM